MHANEFLASARAGKNAFWRYFVTLLAIAVTALAISVVIGIIYVLLNGNMNNIENMPPIASLLVNMSIFPAVLIILFLAVHFLHQRPFRTLITPKPNIAWRRMLLSGALWFLISALGDIITAVWVTPGNYSWSFNAANFIPFAILALILIPIQTSTEELVFRGYLMQAFSLLTKRPWIPLILSAVLFASLHSANPEIAAYGFGWMIPFYLGMGLILGWITLYTGGLEASLGVHIANNLYAGLMVTFPSSAIVSPAFFTIHKYDARLALLTFIISAAVYLALFIWLNGKQPRPKENISSEQTSGGQN